MFLHRLTFVVCGTTGKRKACKDCSCGLAEELSIESKQNIQSTNTSKSSCGNVSYLLHCNTRNDSNTHL